ncbi:MAG: hypothetical protein ACOYI2_00880 [Bacillota bacterium]|jgi:hypothetical protein|nr:hypothetical protein [Clostridia bacterium]
MNHKENKQKLSIPVGDTIAGPHNLNVEFLGMLEVPEPDIIPLINSTDLIDDTGHGTAMDAGTEEDI